jgi:hypothetical protein
VSLTVLVITQSSYSRFRQFLRTAHPTYPVVFRSVQSSILNRHHQIRNSSALNNEHAIFGVVRPEDDKNTVRSRSRVYPDGDDKENIFSEISTLYTYEPIRSVRVPLAFVCSCLCQYTTVSVSALSRARESPLYFDNSISNPSSNSPPLPPTAPPPGGFGTVNH